MVGSRRPRVFAHRSFVVVCAALTALCSVACGGNSRRIDGRDVGSGGSGAAGAGATGGASNDGAVLLAKGDFMLLAARPDGGRLAYVDRTTHDLWTVAPGSAPELVFAGYQASAPELAARADALAALDPRGFVVQWTPARGTIDIGPGVPFAISDDGNAVVLLDDDSGHVLVWHPPAVSLDLGAFDSASGGISAVAADGHLVVRVNDAAYAVEVATNEVFTLAPYGVTRFDVLRDRRSVLFTRGTDPSSSSVQVFDLVGHQFGPAATGTFVASNQDGSGIVVSDGQSFLGFSDRGVATNLGARPTDFMSVLGVSPDLERLAYQRFGGDYEVPLSVVGTDRTTFDAWTYWGAPAYFRGPSSRVIFATKPCACGAGFPYEIAVGDLAEGTTRSITDFDIRAYSPVADDADAMLCAVSADGSAAPVYVELRVVSTSTGVAKPIRGSVGSYLPVSERRLAADVHDEHPGIYLLPIPVP